MARRRQAGRTPRRLTDSERLILNPKRHLRRAIGLGLLVTSSAWAQQPTDEDLVLPPVDVQAQRRFGEYRLLNSDLFKVPSELADYPQSVTIVPQELMREQADFTLRDALRNVTGIGFVAGEGGGAQGDNLTLRGFSARTDIFLDGIRDVGMYTRDTFNLEAVEVFKGPSAVLFGRGSTGGVINQVSKTPKTSRFYEGSFTGGTDVFFRGQADVNQPIGSVAALRLNVMGQSNDIAERDEADIKRWGIAPSFTIGFGTPLQVTGSFFYQREDNLPDYGFPVMFGGQEPIPPVNRRNFYGLANNDYEKTDVYIGTIRADYKYSDDFRLRNETRYGWYGRQALPGVPQPPTVAPDQSLSTVNVTVTRPQRDSEETIVANNLDAVVKWSLLGFKSTLVTGFEISYQTFDITRWTQPQTVTPLLNPNPFRAVPNAQRVLAAKSTSDEFGAGVYAVNDLSITEWLRFLAGVRWDYWNASADIDFPLPVANLSNVTNAWNPRLGLVVEPTKSQMYYFTYGTSSNPSAEALSQTLNAANQNLDPEHNQSFELGAKWTLFDKLGINAALFRIEKTNARTVDPVTGIVELDGKQRVDGFEISAAGEILKGWQVFAGYTYLNPKILEAIDVQNTVPIQGNVLPNVPQSSATLWTTYNFTWHWPIQVGGGAVYASKRYANASNLVSSPSYLTGDLTAAVRPLSNFELRMNIQNISNELFFPALHPGHFPPAAGRTFLFTGTFSY